MSIQTAIWIPPSLCGCMLEMTANWSDFIPYRKMTFADGTTKNMPVTFRQPEQFSIHDLRIVHVCSGHKNAKAPDTKRHFEKRSDGDTYQARGYLRHHENVTFTPLEKLGKEFNSGGGAPVIDFSMDEHEAYGFKVAHIVDSELTEAQHLFEFLNQYEGIAHSYPCGCSSHVFVDDKGNELYNDHPRLTRKCITHQNDDDRMTMAKNDHDAVVNAEKLLQEGAAPNNIGPKKN